MQALPLFLNIDRSKSLSFLLNFFVNCHSASAHYVFNIFYVRKTKLGSQYRKRFSTGKEPAVEGRHKAFINMLPIDNDEEASMNI